MKQTWVGVCDREPYANSYTCVFEWRNVNSTIVQAVACNLG